MRRLAILDDYQHLALNVADWSPLQGKCQIDVLDRPLAVPDEAAERLAPYEILCAMRERMALPRTLLERLPNLKLLAMTGVNFRTLDMDAATERGILVAGSEPTRAGGGFYATSELTWGLVLSTMRHIPREDKAMRDGAWQTSIGTMLYGKTLGVVGLGHVGSRIAAFGNVFGMKVIAWSPNLTQDRATPHGATRVEKDELFSQSDVISLHMVLGERTRNLVGARELSLMKKTAILVNTSRGPLIDQPALIAALRTNQIGGAGLDVYDQEPLPADHSLRQLDNTVLTPHLGYVTREMFGRVYSDSIENVAAYLDGKPIRIVNPAALAKQSA